MAERKLKEKVRERKRKERRKGERKSRRGKRRGRRKKGEEGREKGRQRQVRQVKQIDLYKKIILFVSLFGGLAQRAGDSLGSR